jgi:type II secretory pathway predicted ATPase ExeA
MKALMNYELDSRMPVLFVFMGAEEPALRTLTLSSMREVKDRLGFCYHMPPLKVHETEKYLDKRLKWAGCQNPLFPTDIAEQIWRHSLGVPRRVNFLAGNCLLAAACCKRELIDQPCLQQAISEMQFKAPQEEGK